MQLAVVTVLVFVFYKVSSARPDPSVAERAEWAIKMMNKKQVTSPMYLTRIESGGFKQYANSLVHTMTLHVSQPKLPSKSPDRTLKVLVIENWEDKIPKRILKIKSWFGNTRWEHQTKKFQVKEFVNKTKNKTTRTVVNDYDRHFDANILRYNLAPNLQYKVPKEMPGGRVNAKEYEPNGWLQPEPSGPPVFNTGFDILKKVPPRKFLPRPIYDKFRPHWKYVRLARWAVFMMNNRNKNRIPVVYKGIKTVDLKRTKHVRTFRMVILLQYKNDGHTRPVEVTIVEDWSKKEPVRSLLVTGWKRIHPFKVIHRAPGSMPLRGQNGQPRPPYIFPSDIEKAPYPFAKPYSSAGGQYLQTPLKKPMLLPANNIANFSDNVPKVVLYQNGKEIPPDSKITIYQNIIQIPNNLSQPRVELHQDFERNNRSDDNIYRDVKKLLETSLNFSLNANNKPSSKETPNQNNQQTTVNTKSTSSPEERSIVNKQVKTTTNIPATTLRYGSQLVTQHAGAAEDPKLDITKALIIKPMVTYKQSAVAEANNTKKTSSKRKRIKNVTKRNKIKRRKQINNK